jgi:hypothetical protein
LTLPACADAIDAADVRLGRAAQAAPVRYSSPTMRRSWLRGTGGAVPASAWWMAANSRLIAPSCSSIALSRPSTPALALSAATRPSTRSSMPSSRCETERTRRVRHSMSLAEDVQRR